MCCGPVEEQLTQKLRGSRLSDGLEEQQGSQQGGTMSEQREEERRGEEGQEGEEGEGKGEEAMG